MDEERCSPAPQTYREERFPMAFAAHSGQSTVAGKPEREQRAGKPGQSEKLAGTRLLTSLLVECASVSRGKGGQRWPMRQRRSRRRQRGRWNISEKSGTRFTHRVSSHSKQRGVGRSEIQTVRREYHAIQRRFRKLWWCSVQLVLLAVRVRNIKAELHQVKAEDSAAHHSAAAEPPMVTLPDCEGSGGSDESCQEHVHRASAQRHLVVPG